MFKCLSVALSFTAIFGSSLASDHTRTLASKSYYDASFENYYSVYDRCCGDSHDECKCPVRDLTWFGIKAKWDRKCETVILEKSSIAALGASNEDFSTLVELVKGAGLLETLSKDSADGEGYTLFAPTNEAFAKLGDVNLTDSQIKEVLLYHVVAGTVTSDQLTDGDVTTLSGQTINVEISPDGVVINGSTNVTAPDNLASNGVVHVIDSVLIPSLD